MGVVVVIVFLCVHVCLCVCDFVCYICVLSMSEAIYKIHLELDLECLQIGAIPPSSYDGNVLILTASSYALSKRSRAKRSQLTTAARLSTSSSVNTPDGSQSSHSSYKDAQSYRSTDASRDKSTLGSSAQPNKSTNEPNTKESKVPSHATIGN